LGSVGPVTCGSGAESNVYFTKGLKMRSFKKAAKIGALVLVAALAVAQAFRIEKTNPPVQSDIRADASVKHILKRSCYDCHSNETVWPWYSNVAPVSWLIADDVNGGRKKVNFSEWGNYPGGTQKRKLEEIGEEVAEGNMPLPIYTIMHRNASLSQEERSHIKNWTQEAVAKLATNSTN